MTAAPTRFGPLAVTRRGARVDVVIDNPPTNLVDGAFIGALFALLADLAGGPEVAVVVFSSADPDFFLMHGDVAALVAVPAGPVPVVDAPNAAAAVFQRVASAPWLSIGALDGAARGGGAEFLAALDLRLATRRSVVGQPEVPMGILPGAGGTVRWPRLVGRGAALEVLLGARDLDAETARSLGFLTDVVDDADALAARVDALADRVAAVPVASVAAVKAVVDASLGDPTGALTLESRLLAERLAAGAHHEPMRRFLAAGGQTRVGETDGWPVVLDAIFD
jgi:enoyl-CoA hydratase/carnithine racemase